MPATSGSATMTTAHDLARPWLRRLTRSQLFGGEPPRIGRYAVTGHLGTGGMGVVLRAYDARLERSVAIKLITPSASAGDTAMLAEAAALATLSHPNIVEIFEVAPQADPPHLVMELVEGTRLDEWSRRVASSERATQAMLDAGAALAFAHERGVVHGDFKPANVLVRDDGLVKLVDFGLAESTDVSTQAAPQPGTPGYAAPEQSRLGPSALADQYSFCASFLDVVAGVTPASRGSTSNDTRRRLASAFMDPNTRAVVLRGLSGAPEDRFSSMFELLASLRRGPAWRRAAPWAAALLGVVALGAGASLPPAPPSCEHDVRAFEERWHREHLPDLRGMAGEDLGTEGIELLSSYAEQLSEAGGAACRADSSASARACVRGLRGDFEATVEVLASNTRLTARAADIAAELGDVSDCTQSGAPPQPQHTPELQRSLARIKTLAQAIRYPETEALARETIAFATREGDELAAGKAARWLGVALRDRSPSEAAVHLERAYFSTLQGRDDFLSAECAVALAHALVADLDELGRGTRWNEQAKAHVERLDVPSAKLTAFTLLVDASLLEAQADYEAALEVSTRATSMLGPNITESTAAVVLAHGQLLAVNGKLEDANEVYTTLHRQLMERYGQHSQLTMVVLAVLGALDNDLGEFERGRQRVDKAVAALERLDDPPYAFLIPIYANRAGTYFDAGQWEAAIEAGHQALDALERSTLRDTDGNTGLVLINLSQAYYRAGNHEKGVEYGLRATALLLAARGAQHPHYAHALMAVGKAALEGGDLVLAKDYLTRARDAFETSLGPGHPMAAYAVGALGLLATSENRLEDALDLAQSAYEMLAAGSTANRRASITALFNVSVRLRALDRDQEALAASTGVLERALALPEPVPGLVGLGHLGIAETKLDLGSPSDALTSAKAALDAFDGQPSYEVDFAEARFLLARALFESGNDRALGLGIARSIADGEQAGSDPELRAAAEAWLHQQRR